MLTRIIPARFIILILHLFLTIIILWSRSQNLNACMYGEYSQSHYDTLDVQLIIGVSISFFLFALEFGGFLSAFSITFHWQNVISVVTHAAGIIVLCFYLFDVWCSNYYWYVFGFCCLIPGLTELAVWIMRIIMLQHT